LFSEGIKLLLGHIKLFETIAYISEFVVGPNYSHSLNLAVKKRSENDIIQPGTGKQKRIK